MGVVPMVVWLVDTAKDVPLVYSVASAPSVRRTEVARSSDKSVLSPGWRPREATPTMVKTKAPEP